MRVDPAFNPNLRGAPPAGLRPAAPVRARAVEAGQAPRSGDGGRPGPRRLDELSADERRLILDLRAAGPVDRAALASAAPSARLSAAHRAGDAGAAPPVMDSPGAEQAGVRRVEGEYIDRGSSRRGGVETATTSPFARRFAAVQRLGGPEFMAVGGRLDLFA